MNWIFLILAVDVLVKVVVVDKMTWISNTDFVIHFRRLHPFRRHHYYSPSEK